MARRFRVAFLSTDSMSPTAKPIYQQIKFKKSVQAFIHYAPKLPGNAVTIYWPGTHLFNKGS